MLDWNFGSPGFNPQHFVNQAQSYRPEIPALRTSKQGNEKKFKVILDWGSWRVESCPCGTRALWDGSAWETWLTNPFTVFLSVSLVHSTVSTRQLTLSWSSSCICWLSMSSVWLGGLITPVAVSQRLVGTVCLSSCSQCELQTIWESWCLGNSSIKPASRWQHTDISAHSREKSSGTVWACDVLSTLSGVFPVSCCWGYSRGSTLKAGYQSRLLQERSLGLLSVPPRNTQTHIWTTTWHLPGVSLFSLHYSKCQLHQGRDYTPYVHSKSKIKL